MASSQVEDQPQTQTQTGTSTEGAPRTETQYPRQWNVVLLDDEDHTYDYVIQMMQELFAHPKARAFQLAKNVDTQGRAICLTTHKEHAELKRDQIHGYGRDARIASCKGSMSSIIEPADLGGDGSGDDAGGSDDDKD
jgi:ATP-dependent Clp protease adaptor protein ClpS